MIQDRAWAEAIVYGRVTLRMSYREIANEVGVSCERVRQILKLEVVNGPVNLQCSNCGGRIYAVGHELCCKCRLKLKPSAMSKCSVNGCARKTARDDGRCCTCYRKTRYREDEKYRQKQRKYNAEYLMRKKLARVTPPTVDK